MEKEDEYKYKAVCILLVIIFFINCGVSIWGRYQINRLQVQQNRIEIIQYDYETLTEDSEDNIVSLKNELEEIKAEAMNILVSVLVSRMIAILTTALTLIPKNFLIEIFKRVCSTQYYSNTIEKIIVIETFFVGISFISEIYAVVANICAYQDLFSLIIKMLNALNTSSF